MAKLKTALEKRQYLFNFTRRRFAATFSYKFARLLHYRASPPETVNIFPTDRCNLKCSMCFEKFRHPRKEINISQWRSIIDQLTRFAPRIHLSGGEPLLYPEIEELLIYINKRNLFLVVTTNGTFLKKLASVITETVNQINISIDGPQKLHDQIRGIPGTFDLIIEGVRKINEKKNRYPSIKVHSMINFESPETMFDVLEIARSINAEGVKFLFPLFVDESAIEFHREQLKGILNQDINYWRGADRVAPVFKNLDSIRSIIRKLKEEKRMDIEIFPKFNDEQLLKYYNPSDNFSSVYRGSCRAPWNTATILPDGALESCPDYILGNLQEEKFLTLWNCKKMRNLRMRIKERRFFSVCRGCCFFY